MSEENNKSYVVNQYNGLDMDLLIGSPLVAVAKGQAMLAKNTIDFVTSIGFNVDSNDKNNLILKPQHLIMKKIF